MAILARCEFDATDDAGNLLTDQVTVRVVNESTDALPQLYDGRDSATATALGNPYTSADGKIAFHATGGAYKVVLDEGLATERTLRYRAIGLAGETDFTFARNMGVWDDEVTYDRGDYVVHEGVGIFISVANDNLNNEPDDTTPGSTASWTYLPGLVGVDGAAGEPLVCVVQESGGVEAGTYPVTRFYHGSASFGHLYVEVLVGTGEALFYIHKNGSPVYGPATVDESAAIDVDDLGLTLAAEDTVDLVIESADATITYLLVQMDGSA